MTKDKQRNERQSNGRANTASRPTIPKLTLELYRDDQECERNERRKELHTGRISTKLQSHRHQVTHRSSDQVQPSWSSHNQETCFESPLAFLVQWREQQFGVEIKPLRPSLADTKPSPARLRSQLAAYRIKCSVCTTSGSLMNLSDWLLGGLRFLVFVASTPKPLESHFISSRKHGTSA
jgi:hypothetical protein